MKWICFTLLLGAFCSPAEQVEILERGPHHKRVRITDTFVDEQGASRSRTREYTELENGMHRRAADGSWVETSQSVDLQNDRAVVRGGPMELTFLSNANVDGAVTLRAPDGKLFRSHVLGLAYTDSVTGDSVMFATIQDSQGEVVPPNQVIYRNAFAGEGVQADLLYTWTKGSFEQDVILRQAPPEPSLFNLPMQGVFLEVFTEMIEVPATTRTSAILAAESDPALREQMVMPDFVDETLGFGEVTIGPGRAFLMTTGSLSEKGVGVGKTLEAREGRTFLIERLIYETVKPDLDTLPGQAAVLKSKADQMAKLKHSGKSPFVPVATRHLRAERSNTSKDFQLASAGVGGVGYRIDYVLVSGTPNYTFKSGNTYYVNPAGTTVVLTGTTTLQAGTVIKFNAGKQLEVQGPVVCETAAYRPAILTSRKDNTAGESITLGSPTASDYALAGLRLNAAGQAYTLNDVHIRWATDGIRMALGSLTLLHSQLHQCGIGINKETGSGTLTLRNVLVDQVGTGLTGSSTAANSGQHVTFRRLTTALRSGSVPAIGLKNSILAAPGTAVLNTDYTYSSGSTATDVPSSASDVGIFQTAGGGQNYLKDTSPFRDIGVSVGVDQASIDFEKELRKRTTVAPIPLSSVPTLGVLGAVNAGDRGALDIGYHYARLDFLTTGLTLQSGGATTLVLTNGVAVGVFGPHALSLSGAVTLASEGLPHRLNRLTYYHTVQERTDAPITTSTFRGLVVIGPGASPSVALRFTELSCLAGNGRTIDASLPTLQLTYGGMVTLTDCQLIGGGVTWRPNVAGTSLRFLNCSFEGSTMDIDNKYGEGGAYVGAFPFTFEMRNNLIRGGAQWSLSYKDPAAVWGIYENFFEGVTLTSSVFAGTSIPNTHNAYTSTVTPIPGASNSKTITSVGYATSTLGRYYYSTTSGAGTLFTEMIDTGSGNATLKGLAQHTVLASNTKEAGLVDRGFHYVAVSTITGLPIDSDGDTLFDFQEDRDGNGNTSFQSGETPWWSGSGSVYNSPNGLLANTAVKLFTPLR